MKFRVTTIFEPDSYLEFEAASLYKLLLLLYKRRIDDEEIKNIEILTD